MRVQNEDTRRSQAKASAPQFVLTAQSIRDLRQSVLESLDQPRSYKPIKKKLMAYPPAT